MSHPDPFLVHLRATFRIEADEHLQAMTDGLLQLERHRGAAGRREVVEAVFRSAHSLKGAARAVELRQVESVCQVLEDTFAAWKRGESEPTAPVLDQLHERLTQVAALLAATDHSPAGRPGSPPAFGQAAAKPAAQPLAGSVGPPVLLEDPMPDDRAAAAVRVSVEALDTQLLVAAEMLAVKLGARQRVEDLREIARHLQAARDESAGPQGLQLEQVTALQRKVAELTRAAERDGAAAAKLVDDLLGNTKKLLRLPFATIATPLSKLVRDLCRDLGKEADLRVDGEETVLDKRVLDALRDPLIHLLRNCIDHGLEPPEERRRRGKPARAEVRLSVRPVADDKVQITLADDGAGIDSTAVRAAAVKHGVITAEEAAALSEAQVQALIFRSGVSTSPIVTQLSGRGLGLAIVQEKAAGLGGHASVESRPGAGTVFRIVVPVVRATFRGLLVQAAGRFLVLPTAQVERATRVRGGDLRVVEGRDTCSLAGRVVPVLRLAQVLEIEEPRRYAVPAAGLPLVILSAAEQQVAFAVDQLLDEQEFLVKPLLQPLARVRNVASATVLPNGQIAFILRVADLLQSARHAPATVPHPPPDEPAPAAPPRSILVAEDSITSRMLLKGVLETAGYRVTTALDGLDALERLRAGDFDLVVTDVEMPRLNGFDLTARIRADRRFARLPVVLVTALETREDRMRGVDAGADAYIVKSSFEQSSLVETIRSLL